MKIDAHQHFWQFDPVRDSWITEGAMSVIRRDFLPSDLKPILTQNGIDGCISVQADQSEAETEFLLKQAAENDFIKGVVGWVDLRSDNLQERLEYFKQFPILKGFRHILQGEKPEFMLQSSFIKGIKMLTKYDFTYDILVFPRHLNAVKTFLKQCENQPFVIDHIAKPYIKKGLIKQWAKDMKAIAQYPNVHCKVSGMVTEADWAGWKESDFTPYLDVVFEVFGENSILYGSDFPVCLLAADYEKQLKIVQNYLSKSSDTERVMGANAVRFYNL